MQKKEITEQLRFHYQNFTKLILSLPEENLVASSNGKWSALQLLDHLIKSTSPVLLAFRLPLIFIKLAFGTSARPSRTYDQLVLKYQGKLEAGGKAPSQFLPTAHGSREQQARKLATIINSLCQITENLSEEKLDKYILPHPLLGKLTLREMLLFTIYHVQHHHRQTENNLLQK